MYHAAVQHFVKFCLFSAVLAGMASIASSDDSKTEGRESEKKAPIAITLELDGDKVEVDTQGLEGLGGLAEMIESKLREATEETSGDGERELKIEKRVIVLNKDGKTKVLKADGPVWVREGGEGGHGKDPKARKRVMIFHGDDEGEGHDDEDVEVQRYGDKSVIILKKHGGSDSSEAPYRLGIAIVGPAGFLLEKPQPGSPAAEAGLKRGDLLVTVNGKPVRDVGRLVRKVQAAGKSESTLHLGVVRGHELMVVEVQPERAGSESASANDEDDHESNAMEDEDVDFGNDDDSESSRSDASDRTRKDAAFALRMAAPHVDSLQVEAAKDAIQKAMKHSYLLRLAAEAPAQGMRPAETDRSSNSEFREIVRELRKEVRELRGELRELRKSLPEED